MYGIQSIRKWPTQIRMKYQLLGGKIAGVRQIQQPEKKRDISVDRK